VRSRNPSKIAAEMFRRLTMLAIPIAAWAFVPCFVVCFLACFAAGLVACATGSRAANVKYPARKPDCALSIYHTDLPQVQDWDDIGKVEIICNIDDTTKTCFNRLHAEACRMGGDIIYRLPLKPWRPKEEALGYRAMVAHRRTPQARDAGSDVDPTLPPPASPEESAGPVVPLTGPGAPAAAPAGSSQDAAATDAGKL
jgi:hypothetical protein